MLINYDNLNIYIILSDDDTDHQSKDKSEHDPL